MVIGALCGGGSGGAGSAIQFSGFIRKVQQIYSSLKLLTTKGNRALGALNGTLLRIPQCLSRNSKRKIYISEKNQI